MNKLWRQITIIFRLMAEQRDGEVRNLKLGGGCYEATDTDDGVKKVDSSGSDGGDGLFSANINSGRDTCTPASYFDVHGDVNSPENASGVDGETRFWRDLLARSSFDLGLRPHNYSKAGDSRDGVVTNEDSEDQDTNRHDYFRVTPFDVHGDDHLTGVATYGGGGGGGGGGARDRGIEVGPRRERERGIAPVGEGGGRIRMRQGLGGIFASGGRESVVQRLEQEGGDSGGRRRRHVVVDPRLEQEIATARAGGDDSTQEVPVGIFASDGRGDGEAIVHKLKQEGSTVTIPLAVAVAVVMMMMLMVVAMSVVVMTMAIYLVARL